MLSAQRKITYILQKLSSKQFSNTPINKMGGSQMLSPKTLIMQNKYQSKAKQIFWICLILNKGSNYTMVWLIKVADLEMLETINFYIPSTQITLCSVSQQTNCSESAIHNKYSCKNYTPFLILLALLGQLKVVPFST